MADKKEKLFSDFSPVSTEQWMEKVTADLKGSDFEKNLPLLGERRAVYRGPRRARSGAAGADESVPRDVPDRADYPRNQIRLALFEH